MVGYNITMGGWVYRSGDEFIHNPSDPDRQVHNAKLELGVDSIGTLTFTMPPTHPLISQIELLRYGNTDKSISVYYNDMQLFHGAVVSKSEDMNGEMTVTCKDDLMLLDEAVVYLYEPPPESSVYRSGKYTPFEALGHILAEYDKLVPTGIQLSEGTVPDIGDEASTYGYKVVELPTGKPMTALDALRTLFVEKYGCGIRIAPGTRKVDITSGSYGTNSQIIRFGENIVDYESEAFVDNMYTAVVVVGKTYTQYYLGAHTKFRLTQSAAKGESRIYGVVVDNDRMGEVAIGSGYMIAYGGNNYRVTDYSGSISGTMRLTLDNELVEGLPSGSIQEIWEPYNSPKYKTKRPMMLDKLDNGTYSGYKKTGYTLYSESAVQRYGLRTRVIDKSDEGHIDILLNTAKSALSEHSQIDLTLDITAVDMTILSDGYQHLTAGESVRVISEPHGIDTTLVVSEVSLDLDDPSQTRYTLGVGRPTINRKIESGRLDLAIVENDLLYRMQTL